MAYHKTNKTASQVGEEIKSTITSKFLECLEKGCIPWKEQWNRSESGFLKSDGKSYSFLNTLLLAMDGCTEGEFVTLNGIADRLGIEPKEAWNHIKKGDNGKAVRGHHVYFYTMVPIYLKENGKVVYERDARGQYVLDSKGKKIPKISGHYPMLKSSVVWQVGTEAFCPTKFDKKKVGKPNSGKYFCMFMPQRDLMVVQIYEMSSPDTLLVKSADPHNAGALIGVAVRVK